MSKIHQFINAAVTARCNIKALSVLLCMQSDFDQAESFRIMDVDFDEVDVDAAYAVDYAKCSQFEDELYEHYLDRIEEMEWEREVLCRIKLHADAEMLARFNNSQRLYRKAMGKARVLLGAEFACSLDLLVNEMANGYSPKEIIDKMCHSEGRRNQIRAIVKMCVESYCTA